MSKANLKLKPVRIFGKLRRNERRKHGEKMCLRPQPMPGHHHAARSQVFTFFSSFPFIIGLFMVY